jgi:8-hydroxy-5-deazaflavin:NADPH oxidoreductase
VRIGVLGTGAVGRTLAQKLVADGHEVRMGARSADNEAAVQWSRQAGERASNATFGDAAAFGDLVVNATAGTASLDVLRGIERDGLKGKVLLDVANPLDFSRGFPPSLFVSNTDSLGEQLQRELPDTKVVKALNTVNCEVMVDPGFVPGRHTVFVAGDDEPAKETVTGLLRQFGWPADAILDLGGIDAARATEMYLPLWLRLFSTAGTPHVSIEVKHAG